MIRTKIKSVSVVINDRASHRGCPAGWHDQAVTNEARALWDQEAATFDQAPDHGLHDAATRDAWQQLLLAIVGDQPLAIADLGCGTGTLAVLLAQVGHRVHGIDFAPNMLRIAREKAASLNPTPTFTEGNAADPALPSGSFDVVLSRHVLWAMPDPGLALQRWRRLLRPGGRLILIEGNWSTGAGLTAADCTHLVQQLGGRLHVRPLTDPTLWGGPITDERYLVVSGPHS